MTGRPQNNITPRVRRAFTLLAVLVLALSTGGCTIAETILEPTAAPQGTPTSAEVVVLTDAGQPRASATPEATSAPAAESTEASPTPKASALPLTISPSTGRALPEGAVYRPILAVIDNAAQARPQTGLMLADVVYEFPLDRIDHGTRFLAVFSDEYPLRIGPIRTSRAYLADIALEWGGLYVSLGDPEQAQTGYPLLASSGVRFRVQNTGSAADYFFRDKTVTAIEEHTLFFKASDYAEYDNGFGATPCGNRFQFQSDVSYKKGKPFSSVGIPFSSSDSERVVFTYNAQTGRLVRSDKNSKNVLGESKTLTPNQSVIGYESEPITTQNLIVQYVSVSSYDTMYRSIALTGSGDCDYFINGRHVTGTWSRPSLADPTTYKLYDGSIIRLEPGNTWIEMMPNTRTIKVRYSE